MQTCPQNCARRCSSLDSCQARRGRTPDGRFHDLRMADRSAWEDRITRDRAGIARLSAEIAAGEARIDSIVYGLFNLTPGEIALLESVV